MPISYSMTQLHNNHRNYHKIILINLIFKQTQGKSYLNKSNSNSIYSRNVKINQIKNTYSQKYYYLSFFKLYKLLKIKVFKLNFEISLKDLALILGIRVLLIYLLS